MEPLHGYIMLAEQPLAGRAAAASAFNLGPGDEEEWQVERIASKFAAMWGQGASFSSDSCPSVREASTLRLNSAKAHDLLGWRPRMNTETAFEWTVTWYRQWLQGEDMARETKAQIAAYDRLV
jgi:CDP-glucose 4,6-dehydratase